MIRYRIYSLLILLLGAAYAHAGERAVVYVDKAPAVAPAAAPALVFAPPGPIVDISRDDRQLQAFVGYEEGTITSFVIRMDDLQEDVFHPHGNFVGDSFLQRRAITETVGIRFR